MRVGDRALLVFLALLLAVTAVMCGGAAEPAGGGQRSAAAAFLDTYVRPDGRISRPDQGDDTVSEGQAYALLLAQVTGDDAVFGRIWEWTRAHLQRADGLLSFHADRTGRVLDEQPASDADLLAAWALLRYEGEDADRYHGEGRRIAAAVLAHEVVDGPTGEPVLTAGPWATARPATLNPSYWAPAVLRDLAGRTGDERWRRIADGVLPLTERASGGGRQLPADWVSLGADGTPRPVPAPGGRGARQPQYGLDAQRVVVWLATACDDASRGLAARWWPLLRPEDRSAALALRLDGGVLDPTAAALPLVAAAAAARAAGDTAASDRLLDRADAQHQRFPTYYGAAWVALGRELLTGTALRTC